MYDSGATEGGRGGGGGGTPDFFTFELMEGHVYMVMNLGSGVTKVKATNRRVDDGEWHTVSLHREGQRGRLSVDGTATDFACPGKAAQLDLMGPLFVGGIAQGNSGGVLPREVWSAMLQYGFVGCMRDLVVNGDALDLAAAAAAQNPEEIRPYCRKLPAQCEDEPCYDGVCREGWNRYMCDCAATGYWGPTCFNGAVTTTQWHTLRVKRRGKVM
ncbi:PREDICTED: neurexin-1b-like [Priapulus caudatus]|uniref:Neurexin-1b-like n=1 Tax=Priapulus caudatus TaxID=37621 RepID=A0ABM1EU12_PRICU|nr:PREDICTED: neurexin-1b-like [Priapulus caudatus]